MRQLWFRGYDKLYNTWRYGGIVHMTDYYGLPDDSYRIIEGDSVEDNDIGFSYEVENASVGQYIGLNDTQGSPIYERDIMRVYDKELGAEFIGVIAFQDGSFCIVEQNGIYHFRLRDYSLRVIGNTFDNPELLK